MAQYAERLTTLGAGEICAVFFDITGTPKQRREVTAITRDGGMADLLVEAISPSRRFDYLITPGLKLLDRHGVPVLDVLAHLNRADVAYVVRGRDLADELAYLIARDLLDATPTTTPTRKTTIVERRARSWARITGHRIALRDHGARCRSSASRPER